MVGGKSGFRRSLSGDASLTSRFWKLDFVLYCFRRLGKVSLGHSLKKRMELEIDLLLLTFFGTKWCLDLLLRTFLWN